MFLRLSRVSKVNPYLDKLLATCRDICKGGQLIQVGIVGRCELITPGSFVSIIPLLSLTVMTDDRLNFLAPKWQETKLDR